MTRTDSSVFRFHDDPTARWRTASRWLPLLLFLAFAADAAAAPPVVWLEPSLVRIAEKGQPGAARELTIFAAKGESESFQIAVHAPPGSAKLTGVRIAAAPFVKGSDVIAQSAIVMYREHYLDIPPSAEGPSRIACARENKPQAGRYPDALIPLKLPDGRPVEDPAAFDVDPGNTLPIWVDVGVPRTAAAGTYRAQFTVTTNQGAEDVFVDLVVWEFELPRQPALKSAFLMKTPSEELMRELLRHRLMPKDVSAGLERRLIDELGLNVAAFPCMSSKPTNWKEEASLHQRELPLYCYSIDEISDKPQYWETVRKWGMDMHEAGILQLVTMKPTVALYGDGSAKPRSAVDIWVVLPFQYDESAAACRYVQRKGDEVWSYNTQVQDRYSPKWHIDFAPINFRIQPGFISQSLGLTGLLYWCVDCWEKRRDAVWDDGKRDPFEGEEAPIDPGDGVMVYPGSRIKYPGYAPSMRLKWLRDGVDDFDYVQLLKKMGCGEVALRLSRSVGPDWCNWSDDAAKLEAARRELGETLSRLSRATKLVPCTAPAP